MGLYEENMKPELSLSPPYKDTARRCPAPANQAEDCHPEAHHACALISDFWLAEL